MAVQSNESCGVRAQKCTHVQLIAKCTPSRKISLWSGSRLGCHPVGAMPVYNHRIIGSTRTFQWRCQIRSKWNSCSFTDFRKLFIHSSNLYKWWLWRWFRTDHFANITLCHSDALNDHLIALQFAPECRIGMQKLQNKSLTKSNPLAFSRVCSSIADIFLFFSIALAFFKSQAKKNSNP